MKSRVRSCLNARSDTGRAACALVLAVIIASLSAWLPGNQLAVAAGGEIPVTNPAPIEYRRIYVPADKADAWPRDGEKYIPIESREFEALISAANKSASQNVA